MSAEQYRTGVLDNWFVSPVRLGLSRSSQESSDNDPRSLAWQSNSLCAQTDPEAFFPEKGGSTRDAKKVCISCEVRTSCLDYAIDNNERFGIWGGLSERERRRIGKRAVGSVASIGGSETNVAVDSVQVKIKSSSRRGQFLSLVGASDQDVKTIAFNSMLYGQLTAKLVRALQDVDGDDMRSQRLMTYFDGQLLKDIAKQGGVSVRVTQDIIGTDLRAFRDMLEDVTQSYDDRSDGSIGFVQQCIEDVMIDATESLSAEMEG